MLKLKLAGLPNAKGSPAFLSKAVVMRNQWGLLRIIAPGMGHKIELVKAANYPLICRKLAALEWRLNKVTIVAAPFS